MAEEGTGRGPPPPFLLQLQPAFESRPPTRLACSPPFNLAQDGRGTWGRRGARRPPALGPGLGRSDACLCFFVSCCLRLWFPWSLTISTPLTPRLFLPVPSGFPVSGGVGWVRGHQVERHVLRFSVHPPPHPAHPQRGSDPRPRSTWGGRGEGRRAGGSAWRLRSAVPGLGASCRSHKGGNGSESGKCVVRVTPRGSGSRDSNPRPRDPRGSQNCLSGGEAEKQTALERQRDGERRRDNRGSEDRDGERETGGGT